MTFFEKPEQNKKITKTVPANPEGLHKLLRTFFLYLATAVVIVVGAAIFYFNFAKSSEAVWFDDGWSYRVSLTITHNAADSNKKVKFDIDTATLITAGKMQSDCGDSRFTDFNGKKLRYFIDTAGGDCNTASTDYYVLIPTIFNGTTIIYHYYGNPSAENGTESSQFSEATLTPSTGISAGSEEKGPSPVLYWKFNDGTGTTAQDSSVQNNDGTTSGPTWETGGVAAARGEFSLKFDGTNDLVSKSYSTDTELNPGTANMSVSAWFRHSSTISGTDTLISRASGTLGSEVGYKVYMNSSGYICFGIDDAAGSFPADSACSTATQGSYADSKWHFVEAVKNGTSTITLFIDGRQITQTAVTATLTISGSSPTFYVGIDSDGTSNPWDGLIDDIKVFTSEQSVRSAAQVRADYNARSTADGASAVLGQDTSQTNLVSGLVGWWKMDESSGNAADSSGNSLTLTNNGTTTFTGGKFANASNHNGTTQYFSTATTISGVQTVAFWVNPASTTDDYINLIASTTYINSSSGTVSATGFTSPSIYVNGVLNGSVTASVWNHVAVTTNTGISATAFEAGRANGSYLDNTGKMDDVRIYNRALSGAEISQLYNFAPGPVAYWKFDENQGSNTYDSSGSNLTTTVYNSPSWTTGKFGAALNFNGSTQSVTAILNSGPGYSNTISLWLYPTSSIASKTILTAFKLTTNSSSQPTYGTCTGNAISLNQWAHLEVVSDGSGVCKIYQNGVLTASNTTGVTFGTSVNIAASSFSGILDDVKIYDYARSPKEIVEDMNAGHPAPGSPVGSPVGYWKIDEGFGTNVNDTSENNNDLTMSTASWATAGKFNKAWNGTGSLWISQAADDADFDFAAADDLSISMWFKSDSATNPTSGADQYLAGKGTITNTGTVGYTIYTDNNGKINFGIRSTSGAWGASSPGTPSPEDTVTSVSDIYDGNWHHVVATKTGTSRIDLYVDGRLNASDTSLTATATLENSIVLRVGDDDGDATNSFAGDIDEVKIFRLVLTSDQVKTDFNRGQGVVYGALSTDSTGAAASDSYSREFCVPGDTSTCDPPVAEWKMEEASWTNDCSTDSVFDSSTNSYHGDACPASTGPTTPSSGKIGKAGSFDGTNDYVNTANITSLNSATQLSVSAWFYTNTLAGGDDSLRYIVAKEAGLSTGAVFILRLNTSTDQIEFYLGGVAYVNVVSSAISANRWYHVEATWDGTTMKLYMDGVQVDTDSKSTATGTTTNEVRIASVDIGSGPQRFWSGLIDDVKIYTYGRNPAQVAWDYNRGKPVGHWKFDECQGTTANDSAGNSLSGTISAGAAGITSVGDCTTASTMWDNGESGKWNYSLDFDSTDDNVTVTNADAIDLNVGLQNGLTMAAWVYADTDGEGDAGKIFSKSTASPPDTMCQTDSQSGSNLDIQCELDLSTDATLNISSAITTGTWNHIAMTWTDDSDDEITIWINGANRGSSTDGVGPTSADTFNFLIGNNSAGSATFDGKIDDVRIYNYELTANQIKTLYNQDSAIRYGPATGAP